MSVIENREVKKRLNYLQSQLDLVDSAVGTLPILVASVENERTMALFDYVMSQFKTDLQKLYRVLSVFNDINF